MGPTGVGESTPLAQAVHLLGQAGRRATHVPLHRSLNLRAAHVDDVRAAVFREPAPWAA